MDRRRQVYATYSPVFWRPAPGATGLHARFLAGRLPTPGVTALRTGRGFLIGEVRGSQATGPEGLIDDYAVEADDDWAQDGAALLEAAWPLLAKEGAATLRVVTAAADNAKVAMLRNCSLVLTENWWVKGLTPKGAADSTGRVDGAGFSGIVGPAPPVYDPGGPVLLVEQVAVGTKAAAIEELAAELGAVLAVVPVPAGERLGQDLHQAGFSIASAWYVGRPEHTTAQVS